MSRKRFLLSLCLVIVLMLLQKPIPVAACSCAMIPSPAEGFSNAQAVFSGEVIDIKENSGYGKTVLFAVKETWKGTNETKVAIKTGYREMDCGIEFVVGQEYLIYANLSDMYEEQSLTTTICSPTKELGVATKDLAVFGPGQAPKDDVISLDSGTTTYLIIGGVVFIAGLFAIFGWMRFKKAES
ncbi:hypothetical protein [Sporosarcina sp. YIM B06819]|uniref:hypothetical protein n=1 Tax=Sporosarcina sp. YIM B06819 TaxID=3081769 RepID=UPI00298D4509|nr:hypothetical protein [Sporosarcina sp. YIM B06819]